MGKKVTENPKKVIYYIEKRSICILWHFYTKIVGQKWAKKVKKGQKWPNNLFSRSLIMWSGGLSAPYFCTTLLSALQQCYFNQIVTFINVVDFLSLSFLLIHVFLPILMLSLLQVLNSRLLPWLGGIQWIQQTEMFQTHRGIGEFGHSKGHLQKYQISKIICMNLLHWYNTENLTLLGHLLTTHFFLFVQRPS